MDYVLNILFLIIGFALLIKGADLFVDGSSSVAKIMKIPTVIIGLTIVSIGTSLPEASVSITASLQKSYDLSIANVVGSNIFNLLVVVGASAVICPFMVDKTIMKRDFHICTIATIVLGAFLLDNTLSLLESIILFVFFAAYITLLVVSAIKNRKQATEDYKVLSPAKSIIYIILGIIGIILGGKLTVDSATFFAHELRMSELLIGLTVVAIGTSLPELVTSIVAAKKGESEIALGNVIGSNIFNIFFILGTSGIVHPLICDTGAFIDTLLLLGVCALMYCLCMSGRKVSRKEGVISIVIYLIYVIYAILRAYALI